MYLTTIKKITLVAMLLLCVFVGTCSTPVTNEPDRTPPAAISQLFFYQVLPTAVELGWVAPADDQGDSVKLYDCRFSLDSLTAANWNNAEPVNNLPIPRHGGAYQRVMLNNLDSLTTYYFAIRSMDMAGNYSPLSDVIKKVALPLDTLSPTPITDLAVIRRDTFALQLNWSAPNEHTGQAATRYEIRYDTATITEQNWLAASLAAAPPIPSAPGVVDSFLLTELLPSTRYYCAIRSADMLGNTSILSNIASARTFDTLVPDTIPPDTIPTWDDSLGVVTTQEFGSYTYVNPRGVTADGQGNIVVAGGVRDGGFQNDYYLAKLNDSGQILWEKRFGDGTNEMLNDVTLTTNGLLVAIGGGEGSTESIYWFDQNGNILKVEPIDSSYGASSHSGIAATSDGGVAISYDSYTTMLGGYGNAASARVAKYNVLGEREWKYVLSGGIICVHWAGDVILPSAFAGEIHVADSLIIVSWVGEQSTGIGIGGCGPPQTFSNVTIFRPGGTTAGGVSLVDAYSFMWFPVNPGFLSVDAVSVAANNFQALVYENEIYKLHTCSLQGNIISEVTTNVGVSVSGMCRTYAGAFFVYGTGSTGPAYEKLFAAVVDESGGAHQQFILPEAGKSAAYDALLLADGTVVVIGELTSVDNTATKGLFFRSRP